jgi:hypothetical protein
MARAIEDVAALGEGTGPQVAVQLCRLPVGMHPHMPEVGAKALLHEAAGGAVERPSLVAEQRCRPGRRCGSRHAAVRLRAGSGRRPARRRRSDLLHRPVRLEFVAVAGNAKRHGRHGQHPRHEGRNAAHRGWYPRSWGSHARFGTSLPGEETRHAAACRSASGLAAGRLDPRQTSDSRFESHDASWSTMRRQRRQSSRKKHYRLVRVRPACARGRRLVTQPG